MYIVDEVGIGRLQLRHFLFEAETVVDEFVANLAAVYKAQLFLEVARGEVGAVQERERATWERHRQVVDFFAQHKVGVPTFGIGEFRLADVLDPSRNRDTFSRKGDFVDGAVGERESRKGAGPVAAENSRATVDVAFKAFESPFLILQKTVQGMWRPADVVDQLVGFAFPFELGVSCASGERCESATCIGVGRNLAECRLVPVAVEQVEHFGAVRVFRIFDRYAPGIEPAAESAQNFKFGSVVALHHEAGYGAQRAVNKLELTHIKINLHKKWGKQPHCHI